LDTGSPASGISQTVHAELVAAGLIEATGRSYRASETFRLLGATIEGLAISIPELYVSRRATQVGAEGVLGLDFLAQFRVIHFDVGAMRLTLTG
jgi:hypothetical protein